MRILVLGVTGMIGHKIFQALVRSNDHVLGTVRGDRDRLTDHGVPRECVVGEFDAADAEHAMALLDRAAPSVVINCIGITKRKAESGDLARMFQVNTLFPHQLARWADRAGARVIQFSTDCVFDGTEGQYDEQSVVTAADLYGQTKYFGELTYNHCLTIRTSMIGRELAGRTELLEWFLAQRGTTVPGFVNALYSGLTTNEMGKIVSRVVHDHPLLCGRYQIAGPIVTKYELLCKVRDAFGVDVHIVPDSRFVCDRTLRSRRFETATGITVPSWDQMLAELVADCGAYDVAG